MQQMWTDIDAYIDSHLIPDDPILVQTLQHTDERGYPDHLAVAPNQGMLLQMLMRVRRKSQRCKSSSASVVFVCW